MKTTRRRRVARKLILPLLAVGPMTALMGFDATHRLPYRPPSAALSVSRTTAPQLRAGDASAAIALPGEHRSMAREDSRPLRSVRGN